MSAHAAQKEFLLEVGTEEIPAWMMEPALADLKRLLEEGSARHRLAEAGPLSLEVYGTPRRLVAYCPNLPARQPDSVEQVQGPPQRIAFDAAGKPTPAAVQFAAKMGTKPEKLQTITTAKGEYLSFRKTTCGKPTAEVLRELVPQVVLGISFPRTMHWEGKAGPHFIRPIRSLLVLYGGRVIPCSIGNVQSGATTFGHRRLGKPRLPVRDFAGYRETLRNNFVLLNPQERRARIVEQIQSLLASEPGFRWKQNEELLDTLVYLTEYPTPLLGEFDPAFLSLPEEVLITVMRGHQKYFAVEQANGILAPRFVAVMNLDRDRTGAIRHGNERVLRARFNDARFFWETDAKLRLEDRLEMLKHVTFQSQLGSYYDKAERMGALANGIVLRLYQSVAKTPPNGLHSNVIKAARLAKCDLTTNLVKEFTELQGVVGGLCARREGLPSEIADAIYDQYKPQSMEDALPRTLAGDIVSLADRMDTLVGCFGVGLAPSGSKDPFGLRRAAQGVIRILAEKNLPLTLDGLVGAGCTAYSEAPDKRLSTSWEEQTPLIEFLEERLRYYLREVRGFAYDEVNAVLAARSSHTLYGYKNYEVVDILKRLEAVAKIRPTENFEPLAVAFKRMKNILQQARQEYGFTKGNPRPELLEPGPELELYQKFSDIFQQAAREKDAGNYFAALESIAALRPAVDRFFDKVLVMAPQEEIRNNRLRLLDRLLNEFSIIADFSEIVTTDQTRTVAP